MSSPLRTGLIGAGIGGSRSPWMHETEAASLGLDLTYTRFDLDLEAGGAEALPRLLDHVATEGFLGVNITHPVKQAVIPLLDDLSEDARVLGAVNTVVLRGGRRVGHNTDWFGFAEGLRLRLPDARLGAVVQMGAGGAGSAIAYALLRLGAEAVRIFDLDAARAQELVDRLESHFPGRIQIGDDLDARLAAADGLVNTTPLGMDKYPGMAVPAAALRPDLWVAEVVYVPLETELLRTARAAGCPTADGGAMAVIQAAEAFRLFTGATPDTGRMLQRFEAALA
ncbi:MAG: shikimate dehydrogenase [Caulobacterales bacterium 68-7]|nr:MAG: shikimate dehydrogenase [Caulobacterales bacterium 68-7]